MFQRTCSHGGLFRVNLVISATFVGTSFSVGPDVFGPPLSHLAHSNQVRQCIIGYSPQQFYSGSFRADLRAVAPGVARCKPEGVQRSC